MRTYTHTIEMDTVAGRTAFVEVVFEAEGPMDVSTTIDGILALKSTQPLAAEDMDSLYEWLMQDRKEWK